MNCVASLLGFGAERTIAIALMTEWDANLDVAAYKLRSLHITYRNHDEDFGPFFFFLL